MKPAIFSILSFGLAWFVIPQATAPDRPKPAATLREYLALTQAQQQALNRLQAGMREKARASIHNLEDKQKALRTRLASSGDGDALEIGKLVLQLEVAKNQAEATSESLREQALAQLTAEQRSKVEELERAKAMQPVVREAIGMFLLAPPDAVVNGTGPLGMFSPRGKPFRVSGSL